LGSNEDLNLIESTVKLTISTIDSRNLKIPLLPPIPHGKSASEKAAEQRSQNARRRKSLYAKKDENPAGWLRD
jgi:hypothetical protein